MVEGVINFIASIFGGALVGHKLDDRRRRRARSSGSVICGIRDPKGLQASQKWRRGTASVSTNQVELDGLTLDVTGILFDTEREPTFKESMWINPDMHLLQLVNGAGDFEIALFPQDIAWFASAVLGHEIR